MPTNFSHILGNHDLQLSNIARIGKIEEVQDTTARVRIGETVTDFFPFMVPRAAQDFEWWQPSVGEQVIVLSLWGDISQGVILGAIPQEAYAPPTNGINWGARFRDGTVLTYNPENHTLNVQAGQSPVVINCKTVSLNCQQADITASGGISLETPSVSCTGTITVTGDVIAGGVSLMNHRHDGVQPGKGITGKPQ